MNKSTVTVLAIIMLLLAASACFAKHSDTYLFGSYSYINHGDKFFQNNSRNLAAKLKELGYNITVMDTNNNDKSLAELLEILDNNGIDAFLTDKCWSTDPNNSRNYALVGLSTSNYQRFEAEFANEAAVKPEDINSSVYWYGTQVADNNKHLPPRIGKAEADKDASYDYAWKLVPGRDQEGYAYTDVTYRWKDQQGKAVKLSDELRFYNTHQEKAKNVDSLYITLRVKIGKISSQLRSDAVLFSFNPTGYTGRPTEFVNAVDLAIDNGNAPLAKQSGLQYSELRLRDKKGNNGKFTYADYLALGSPDGYFELEYSISYNDLDKSGIFSGDLDFNPNTTDSWWWIVMRGFSPRIYWQANCEFSLDYIDFEDQLHRNIRTRPELYRSKINRRLRDFVALPHGDIIRYCYTMDEPFQPNLDSYIRLQKMVDTDLPKPITTFYDIMHRRFAMADGKSYFDHVDLARELVKPQTLMIDIYPIKPNVNFNAGEPNFLQDVLDHQLLKSYAESKKYIDEQKDGTFYPVVQAFGYWDSVNWLSWMMPPTATQKALLYLPLCYQPDGMVTYRLFGFVHENGAGEYASLSADPKGEAKEFSYIWDSVYATNPKVKSYGDLMQHWTWLSANTAMPGKQTLDAKAASTGISSVSVTGSGKGDYKGYIQCGYYLDDKGNGAVFAVNRRTDYSLATKKSAYKTAGKIPPQQYPDYYKEHAPQNLVLNLAKGTLGKFPAVYDPISKQLFPGKKTNIEVQLPAGEGKLLQLVETLPTKTKKGSYNFSKPLVVKNKSVLLPKANIICNGDLILLPGSSLTISKGSSLTVLGDLVRMEGSDMKVEGTLQLNKRKN